VSSPGDWRERRVADVAHCRAVVYFQAVMSLGRSRSDRQANAAVPNRGMFASEDDALVEVVKRLVAELNPEEIWLFGSRAVGRHSPDSDFDLLVVTNTADGDAGFDYDRVYAPLKGIGVGCEVIPCRADAFAVEREDRTSFCWRIVRTGRRIYERGGQDRGILRAG
jgi:predicted nucleotidyltransferase